MISLQNQVAIITGAGSGIGLGCALALAGVGARLALCGRRSAPLAAAARAVEERGGQVVALPADVSNPQDVARVVQETLASFGTLDILINNAGIDGGGPVHEHSLQEWKDILEVNLTGPFLMARAVLPVFREKRSGHIINISSESGIEHYAGDGAYGVSKHALNALGEYIQRENQELNIRVNTICPGMVVTEMTSGTAGLDHTKCLYPEDIAELVIWLLTRRPNIKIGTPVLIQTMQNPWE